MQEGTVVKIDTQIFPVPTLRYRYLFGRVSFHNPKRAELDLQIY